VLKSPAQTIEKQKDEVERNDGREGVVRRDAYQERTESALVHGGGKRRCSTDKNVRKIEREGKGKSITPPRSLGQDLFKIDYGKKQALKKNEGLVKSSGHHKSYKSAWSCEGSTGEIKWRGGPAEKKMAEEEGGGGVIAAR